MEKILDYSIENDGLFRTVKVFDEGCNFFEIECLFDSPYSIEEEIQNWLDDNGYGDELFSFNRIYSESLESKIGLDIINFENED